MAREQTRQQRAARLLSAGARRDLSAMGISEAAVEELATATLAMFEWHTSADESRRHGVNASTRAKRFKRIAAAAHELETLISGTWPNVSELVRFHEETERLFLKVDGQLPYGHDGFPDVRFPSSWGESLDALRYWARAAELLHSRINAERRQGPSPAPEWRKEFVGVLASIVAHEGIGVRTKNGKFAAVCRICYAAARLPNTSDGDIKAFISARSANATL